MILYSYYRFYSTKLVFIIYEEVEWENISSS